MAGAHPGVVEAGNSVDHGLTVGGGWAKAAPLVAQPHLAGSREQLAQSAPDALDDLGADLGGVVALVAGAAGQQPTIGHGPDPQARAVQAAGQPEADRLGHHQVAFDQPLRQPHPGFGGQPGGEHHHPRVQLACGGPDPQDAPPAHLRPFPLDLPELDYLNPELRALIADESDFDRLRGNPEFEKLTLGPAPLA